MPLLFVPEQVSQDGLTGYARWRGREASVWLSDEGSLSAAGGSANSESRADRAELGGGVSNSSGPRRRQPIGEDLLPDRVSYFKGRRSTGAPACRATARCDIPSPGQG